MDGTWLLWEYLHALFWLHTSRAATREGIHLRTRSARPNRTYSIDRLHVAQEPADANAAIRGELQIQYSLVHHEKSYFGTCPTAGCAMRADRGISPCASINHWCARRTLPRQRFPNPRLIRGTKYDRVIFKVHAALVFLDRCRISHSHRVVGNILGNYRARTDYSPSANGYPR